MFLPPHVNLTKLTFRGQLESLRKNSFSSKMFKGCVLVSVISKECERKLS